MKRILGLVLVLLIASAIEPNVHTARADEDTMSGSFLLVSCELTIKNFGANGSAETHFEAYRDGWCRGVVAGVDGASPNICPPAQVTMGQEIRVATKYLQDHPEALHRRGPELVELALSSAFPCQKK